MSPFIIATPSYAGQSLPSLIWATLQRQPSGLYEEVLDRQPELADMEDGLPLGTEVRIYAEEAVEPKAAAQTVIRLWD
jgi:phage tail protein X